MPVGESLIFDTAIPEFEAIIQNALPESLLKLNGKYMTSQVYDKTIVYKGKEYTPGPMRILYVNEDYINVVIAPGSFKFNVGGKAFQIGSDRKRITIISGGEPILWREAVADPQSYDPVDSVGTPLQGDECRITNGLAQTPFSYFYMTGGVGGILQSIPLQDGTVFRQRKTGGVPGQQSYGWYRFSKTTGGGGIFREVDTVLDVYISTIKNIDFTKLGDLDAIVDAMDTVNGKPFDAIFSRDLKKRIEMNILLNAQTDSRQNGVYYLSAVDGDNTASTIARVSPLLKWTLGYIGRTKVTVWHGDRFGQDEAWLSSSNAIRPESKDPRVSFDTTPHVWIKSKPEIALEERVYSNLEKITKLEEEIEGVADHLVTEADPVALEKLSEAKTELEKAIGALPTNADIEKLSDVIAEINLNKLDKTDAEALQIAVEELNTAIAAGATQDELDAAIKKVEDTIAAIPKGVQPPKILYTTATTITVAIGDEVHIEGEGNIQLPTAPPDGSEIKVFDNFGNIKAGKNNILAGTGDTWQMPDDTFENTPLQFDVDDQLRNGWMRLKYTAKTKSWWPFVVYGKPVTSSTGSGLSEVQHDFTELNPLPISSTPSVQFHLEGGGGAFIPADLPSGWWGTVLNTTNSLQSISFDDTLTVFLRDGSQTDPIESPYQVNPNSFVTLQMVENGFKFLQIIPSGGTAKSGDRLVTVVLPTLPANRWVDWPLPTGDDAGKSISLDSIQSSTGDDWTDRFELNRIQKRVRSLSTHADVQFTYEVR